MTERMAAIQVGVVVRKQPGVTRWADWVWRPVALIPGAPPADWRELRREGETVDYHAATCTLEVHRAETEAYLVSLSNEPPVLYVIMRPSAEPGREYDVFAVTASAFEAQDYLDSGEELVEPVPMPPSLIAWVSDFVGRHHKEETFVKRRRKTDDMDQEQDGIGDPRISQDSDVYRAPTGARKREKLN